MTLSKRNGLLLLGLSLLVLASVAFIIIREVQARRQSMAFTEALERVDQAAGAEDSERATELLDGAASSARTQAEWLSVLKRAVRLSRLNDDWSAALRLSREATAELPGSEPLWAVTVYATMRGGENASAIARAHLSSERYRGLKAEAFLRSGSTAPADGGGAPGLSTLDDRSEPQAFERAFELTEDPRFLTDAALRYAAKGELERALQVALQAEATEPALYMAYDLGAYQRALTLLQRLGGQQASSTQLSLLRADIERQLGNTQETVRIYREVIASAPSASPAPYQNALWASQLASVELPAGYDEPIELALNAARHFPGNTTLARIAALLLHRERPPEAKQFLTARVAEVEQPGTLRLLRFHLYERNIPVQARIARVWELWNRHKELSIARYLAWLSASIGDYRELQHIVDTAGPDRLPMYAAIHAVRRDDLAQAAELFGEALAGSPETAWRAAANLAAVLRAVERYEESVAATERGVEALQKREAAVVDTAGATAVLLYQRALSLAAAGERNTALAVVREALSYDGSFGEARMLHRRLADAVNR